MNPFRKSLAAAILLGSLATAAHAGQRFGFSGPPTSTSTANALFSAAVNPPAPYIQNRVGTATSQTVQFQAFNFSNTGAYLGTSGPITAQYFLHAVDTSGTVNLTDYRYNDRFEGNSTGEGTYSSGSGLLTFVSPNDATNPLLQVTFDSSLFSNGGFIGASGVRFVGGSLLTTTEVGNENYSFTFLPINGSSSLKTANFAASIGTVGVVPEPASLTALALGGLALLRRRRKA